MKEAIIQMEQLLLAGHEYLTQASEHELCHKISPEKWSKKELLGHLIDSAIHNLQRFSEIEFEEKPYRIRPYKQDALVHANRYQLANTNDLLILWKALNMQILHIMRQQTEQTLIFQIELAPNNFSDLQFLMQDYISHLEHHLVQITSGKS